MLDVTAALKLYALVSAWSLYQPVKLYPVLVGSAGLVAFWPEVTLWLITFEPPFE